MAKRITVTGHRHWQFPTQDDFTAAWYVDTYNTLLDELDTEMPALVNVGGALGWDTMVMEACYELTIPYNIYLPFEGMSEHWPPRDQSNFRDFRDTAQEVFVPYEKYLGNWQYQKRNEQMLDNCNEVWALWDPERKSGGTWNTLQSAKERGLTIKNFWHSAD